MTALPTMWAVATLTLGGEAAAGGIAMINSIGQFGGFGGPYQVGFVTELTGSFSVAMLTLSGWLAVAALVLFAMTRRPDMFRRESNQACIGGAGADR